MTRHIAYLMRVGTEGLHSTYTNTPQNHRRKAHMPVYKVGVGRVINEFPGGYNLDGTVEKEARRIAKDVTILQIFRQTQTKITKPSLKIIPRATRVEEITEEQYQRIQSFK